MAWIVNDVLPMAFAVGLLGALLAVPVIGAAQTAQDPFASAWRFTAFSATLVVLLVLVALLLLDSLAYLYGFHRPFLVIGARWRVEMGAPVITRPMAFVLRSVLAFALTLFWFTLVYESVSHRWCGSFRPGPLDFVSSLYFAIVTAATVGYGDIAPATNAARLLVALQVVVSFGFTVFIFAGIASLARPGGMGPESGDHA